MRKLRERTQRCDYYRQLAAGYRALRSPLAETFSAAAEHFQESDPPAQPADRLDRRLAHDTPR